MHVAIIRSPQWETTMFAKKLNFSLNAVVALEHKILKPKNNYY